MRLVGERHRHHARIAAGRVSSPNQTLHCQAPALQGHKRSADSAEDVGEIIPKQASLQLRFSLRFSGLVLGLWQMTATSYGALAKTNATYVDSNILSSNPVNFDFGYSADGSTPSIPISTPRTTCATAIHESYTVVRIPLP
jgi:hypothetical protein